MKEINIIKRDGNRAIGIFQSNDGLFTAMTYAKSKEFKTLKGAEKWLKKMGYE